MTSLFVPLTMGLSVIDESLEMLLEAMQKAPNVAYLGDITGYAKILGLLLAWVVAGNECYNMILGRRGMDVMKLLRIVAISLCITSSGWICEALTVPGYALEEGARAMTMASHEEVVLKEKEVAQLKQVYSDSISNIISNGLQEVSAAGQATDKEDPSWYEKIANSIRASITKAINAATTQLCELLNDFLRFIAGLLFQLAYYGNLMGSRVWIMIMTIFAPITFALSLAPPFRAAWSQMISKICSVSLWGFVTYMVVYYMDVIYMYALQQDVKAYEKMLGDLKGGQDVTVTMLSANALGTTCLVCMSLLTGFYMLRMVPEVASWLIPGGVSSGLGGMTGAKAGHAGSMARAEGIAAGKAIKGKIF